MEVMEIIRRLNRAPIVAKNEMYWLPEGELGVVNLRVSKSRVVFDLLVPTGLPDQWDYILRSERKLGSTEKIQIFQADKRVPGGEITAISREGQGNYVDVVGPEQYRLKFDVPLAALSPEKPIEVRFYWKDELIATAHGKQVG